MTKMSDDDMPVVKMSDSQNANNTKLMSNEKNAKISRSCIVYHLFSSNILITYKFHNRYYHSLFIDIVSRTSPYTS